MAFAPPRSGIASDYNAAAAKHRRTVDGADRGGAGDLALIGAAGHLADGLGDMAHSVHAALAQTAAEGIDRQFALDRDTAIANECGAFAFAAKAGRLQPIE